MEELKERKKGLSGSALKWIAVFSMLADHSAHIFLGKILVRNGIYSVSDFSISYIRELILTRGSVGWVYAAYLVMRGVIGRAAFPLFCFLLVEGFCHTRNKGRYAGRLFLFCLLSEIPFDLAFYGVIWKPENQNVFFTLLIGFLCMWGMEKIILFSQTGRRASSFLRIRQKAGRTDRSEGAAGKRLTLLVKILLVFGSCVLAELIHCDYAAKGVIAILLLYLFRLQKAEQLIACGIGFFWEPGALLALIPLGFYNGKRGSGLKYFFYLFYPVHLLLLYGLERILFLK